MAAQLGGLLLHRQHPGGGGQGLNQIEGSYALGIICVDYPDQIIAARKDCPLVLGYGDGCNFWPATSRRHQAHRDVAYMEDGEIAVLTADRIQVL